MSIRPHRKTLLLVVALVAGVSGFLIDSVFGILLYGGFDGYERWQFARLESAGYLMFSAALVSVAGMLVALLSLRVLNIAGATMLTVGALMLVLHISAWSHLGTLWVSGTDLALSVLLTMVPAMLFFLGSMLAWGVSASGGRPTT